MNDYQEISQITLFSIWAVYLYHNQAGWKIRHNALRESVFPQGKQTRSREISIGSGQVKGFVGQSWWEIRGTVDDKL